MKPGREVGYLGMMFFCTDLYTFTPGIVISQTIFAWILSIAFELTLKFSFDFIFALLSLLEINESHK